MRLTRRGYMLVFALTIVGAFLVGFNPHVLTWGGVSTIWEVTNG